MFCVCVLSIHLYRNSDDLLILPNKIYFQHQIYDTDGADIIPEVDDETKDKTADEKDNKIEFHDARSNYKVELDMRCESET